MAGKNPYDPCSVNNKGTLSVDPKKTSTSFRAEVSAWGLAIRSDRVLGGECLAQFPEVARWFKSINARPAVAKVQ